MKKGLEIAAGLIATLTGEEQMKVLNEALKEFTWVEINEAVEVYKAK